MCGQAQKAAPQARRGRQAQQRKRELIVLSKHLGDDDIMDTLQAVQQRLSIGGSEGGAIVFQALKQPARQQARGRRAERDLFERNGVQIGQLDLRHRARRVPAPPSCASLLCEEPRQWAQGLTASCALARKFESWEAINRALQINHNGNEEINVVSSSNRLQ